MKVIETSVSRIWKDEDGIYRVRFTDLAEMGSEEADEHIAALLGVMNNVPGPILTDGRDMYGTMHPEARDRIARHPELIKLRKAQALVTNSIQTRLVA
jgi:hypothetical protein